MKTEIAVARFLSALLHPLVIPVLGLVILFNIDSYVAYSIPLQARRFILLIVFINTVAAPLLSIMMLKRTGIIKSILLDERADRLYPLLLSALFLFLTYFLLRRVAIPSIINFYIIGAALLVVTAMFITFKWKISIHMTSIGGMTGFLIVTSLLLNVQIIFPILAAIFFSGLLGFSRIRLQAHTPSQVYAGFLLGLAGMLLLYFYLAF